MSWKALLALVVLGFGLYAYIHLGIEKPAEAEAEQEKLEAALIKGPLESLEKVIIRKNDGESLQLEIQRDYWYVIKPFKDLARMSQIERLYKSLREAKIEKVLFEGDQIPDLKDFGLDESSKTEFVFKRASKPDEESFLLGRRNPSGSGFYALLNQPPRLALISTSLEFIKTDRAQDYREMKLVNVDVSALEELEIKKRFRGKVSELIRLKKEDGQWTLQSPEKLPLNQEEVARRLSKFPIIRASKFLDRLPKALRMPTLTITALFSENVRDPRSDTGDELSQGIRVEMSREIKEGKENPGPDDFTYYATSDKTPPALIARFHYDNFSKGWKELVRKTFDQFLIDDVLDLKIESPTATIDLVQQADSLKINEGGQLQPANKEAFQKAIKHLRQLRASEFLESRESFPERGPDQLKLSVRLKDGQFFQFQTHQTKDGDELFYQEPGQPVLHYKLLPKTFSPETFRAQDFKSSKKDS